jgi:hypothetical protein
VAVALPYEFDTVALPRNILKGIVAAGALMALLALVMFAKYGPLAAVPFTVAICFFAWIGRKYRTTFADYAKGAITQEAVIVEASALGPIRLPTPAGRHPLSLFKAVRVTYLGPNRNSAGYLYAQIHVVGAKNVCVAYERDTAAKALAPELAAALRLPLEEVGLAPFDH